MAASVVVLGTITWAAYAPLDKITRGAGQVIASSHTQVIQAADGGVIQILNVREGDKVKRGQLLATLDKVRVEALVKESAARAAALRANIARLKAEVFGGSPVFGPELVPYPEFVANQKTLFSKRQAAINEEVSALNASLAGTAHGLAKLPYLRDARRSARLVAGTAASRNSRTASLRRGGDRTAAATELA
jgi:adhesin transport system membrane fusion protein